MKHWLKDLVGAGVAGARVGVMVAVAGGLGAQIPSLQYPLLHWLFLLHR